MISDEYYWGFALRQFISQNRKITIYWSEWTFDCFLHMRIYILISVIFFKCIHTRDLNIKYFNIGIVYTRKMKKKPELNHKTENM